MLSIFSAQGQHALAEQLARRPLLAFDFDGTLAPIVAHPDEARMPPAAVSLLEALARHYPLAIISGRAVADLQLRLDFHPQHLVGEHGAHQVGNLQPSAHPAMQSLRQELLARQNEFSALGVLYEDKPHSLSLHYRMAHDPQSARAGLLSILGTLDASLCLLGGKEVINIIAADAPDKGQALRTLMSEGAYQSAIYVGDDDNDEPAFAALANDGLGIRAGPARAASHAAFSLADQHEITRLLQQMLQITEGLSPP